MDILQLKVFRDIAAERSFVRAGKANNLTQPSVSLHVKRLEMEFGVKLFERTPRRVRLTPMGERLLPAVEDLLYRAENVRALLAGASNGVSGQLRIAAVNSIGLYDLSSVVTAFVKACPEVDIDLRCERSDDIYGLLLQGKIDLGIVALPHGHSRVEVTPFGEDELILIAPPGHPFCEKRSVSKKQVSEADFIAFGEGCPTRYLIKEDFEKSGFTLNPRISNDNVDMLVRSVEAGLGVAIVPATVVAEELRGGAVTRVVLSDFSRSRSRGILKLRESQPHPAAERFVRICSEFLEERSGQASARG